MAENYNSKTSSKGPWAKVSTNNPENNKQKFITAKTIKSELSSHIQSLNNIASSLAEEKRLVSDSLLSIKNEIKQSFSDFIDTCLTEMTGKKFDQFNALIENTATLGTSSLEFQKNSAIKKRNDAISKAEKLIDTKITPESFSDLLKTLEDQKKNASLSIQKAESTIEEQKKNFKEWQKTSEYMLVKLDETLRANGQPALTPDNRGYYEPKTILDAIIWNFSKGEFYRTTREYLKGFEHGKNGIDAFADMPTFRQKNIQMHNTIQEAPTQYKNLEEVEKKSADKLRAAKNFKDDIKTDAEILTSLKEHILKCFNVPEFLDAVSKVYSSEFPKNIFMLQTKKTMLEKLLAGLDSKITNISSDLSSKKEDLEKIKKLDSEKKLAFNLENYQDSNRTQAQNYSHYAEAATKGHRSTLDYAPALTTTSTRADNNGHDLLEMMLLNQLLFEPSTTGDIIPNALSSYSADLFGTTHEQASDTKSPEAEFEASDSLRALILSEEDNEFNNTENYEETESISEGLASIISESEPSSYSSEKTGTSSSFERSASLNSLIKDSEEDDNNGNDISDNDTKYDSPSFS
jgi:hypothetical protein